MFPSNLIYKVYTYWENLSTLLQVLYYSNSFLPNPYLVFKSQNMNVKWRKVWAADPLHIRVVSYLTHGLMTVEIVILNKSWSSKFISGFFILDVLVLNGLDQYYLQTLKSIKQKRADGKHFKILDEKCMM